VTHSLLIGVTQDFMLVNKKHSEVLEPFHKRAANAENFLKKFDKNLSTEIYALEDGLGPYKQCTIALTSRFRCHNRV
jgi:pantetheine-phosphate adenylyltransferase